jgi:hypothetical protein
MIEQMDGPRLLHAAAAVVDGALAVRAAFPLPLSLNFLCVESNFLALFNPQSQNSPVFSTSQSLLTRNSTQSEIILHQGP